MARTRSLNTINREIEKLQKLAASVKAKEVAGVIERIKSAIDHYDLTAEDLFGVKKRMGRPPKNGGPGDGKKKVAQKAKPTSVPKFQDESGRTWTGHGKRPGWFLEALASGKTAEDLLIKGR